MFKFDYILCQFVPSFNRYSHCPLTCSLIPNVADNRGNIQIARSVLVIVNLYRMIAKAEFSYLSLFLVKFFLDAFQYNLNTI